MADVNNAVGGWLALQRAVVVGMAVVSLAACGDDDGGGSGGSGGRSGTGGSGGSGGTGGGSLTDCVEIETPTGEPTFDAIYDEVLCTNTCTDSFCHGGSATGGLHLESRELAYTSLVGAMAQGDECGDMGLVRVIPFDAENSLLVRKLQPNPVCGDVMPQYADQTEAWVPDAQIEQIRQWINAGALRNPPSVPDGGALDGGEMDGGN